MNIISVPTSELIQQPILSEDLPDVITTLASLIWQATMFINAINKRGVPCRGIDDANLTDAFDSLCSAYQKLLEIK